MATSPSAAQLGVKRHLTSSILPWVRTDQPRQTGIDYWKGPHSGIISATPGLEEYRQIHLAEHNPGLWPVTDGVQTSIPADRKIDGVAEVTFQSALSPLQGRTQTRLAYKDEINVQHRRISALETDASVVDQYGHIRCRLDRCLNGGRVADIEGEGHDAHVAQPVAGGGVDRSQLSTVII